MQETATSARRTLLIVFLTAPLLLGPAATAQYIQQGPKLVGIGAADASGVSGGHGYAAISGDGNTLILGAPGENGTGAAWVWVRTGTSWSRQGSKIMPADAEGFAKFGSSVALSDDGNTAAIGGPGDANGQGAVWVWTRTGSEWTQQGPKLVGTGAVTAAAQGSSVAISSLGDTILCGGPRDATSPVHNWIWRGAAWIWTRSGNSWTQQGPKLVGTNTDDNARQGTAVALAGDGSTAMIGGPGDGTSILNGNFVSVGAVWVFTRSGGSWTQNGTKLVGSGNGVGAQGLATSLSHDGNTALSIGVSCPVWPQACIAAAWAWSRSGAQWVQQGSPLVGNDAVLSYPVSPSPGSIPTSQADFVASAGLSADGQTVIVGFPRDANGVGAAWVWARNGESWTQQAPKFIGAGADSVSISHDGNTVVVGGAGTETRGQGSAWVWTRSNTTWTRLDPRLVASDTVGTTGQGRHVALSGDGNTLWSFAGDGTWAVWIFTRDLATSRWSQYGNKVSGVGPLGALSSDGNTAVGLTVGGVFVWTRSNTGVWTRGANLPTPSGFSYSIASLAISADGKTVAVGVMNCCSSGPEGVWVFTRSGDNWTQDGDPLTGSGASGDAHFGYSVALSADGTTLLVGGPGDASGIGAVWVFKKSSGVWAQEGGKLFEPDFISTRDGLTGKLYGPQQGSSVALSADGNTALVGAPQNGVVLFGQAYGGAMGGACVFVRNAGVWSQQGHALYPFGHAGQQAGTSVALSADGNTAVAGGTDYDQQPGGAWVWHRVGTEWRVEDTLVGSGSLGKTVQYPASVAISADAGTVAIGGPQDAGGVGAAWVFVRYAATVATSTTLTSSLNPALAGDPVEFSVKVTSSDPAAGIPTGFVTLFDGSTWKAVDAVEGDGTAHAFLYLYEDGPHSIVARFDPYGNFIGSTSAPVTQIMNSAADVGIEETLVGPSSCHVGDSIYLSVVVNNWGPDKATNVVVVDTLPLGLDGRVATATPSQGSCASSGATIRCSLGDLSYHEQAKILVEIRPPLMNDFFRNTVTVSAHEPDSRMFNNEAWATFAVQQQVAAVPALSFPAVLALLLALTIIGLAAVRH